MTRALNPARSLIIRAGPETREAAALNDWVLRRHPLVWRRMTHIPNERQNAKEAMVAQLMGAKSGTFDYWFGEPRGVWHGFWLELKATGRTWASVSLHQRQFGAEQSDAGYFTAIAYGLDHAMVIIDDYFASPQPCLDHHHPGVLRSAKQWDAWNKAAA